jgi:hypothetical protein
MKRPQLPLLFLGLSLALVLAGRLFSPSWAAGAEEGKSSSMRMMERIERIVYGETNKGGIIDRMNSVEKELFGRSLPGSISERHTATLNFLEVGTAEQPSMLFKLGVCEWLVGSAPRTQVKAALKRVEDLETELNGEMQYGKPLAMRVERVLASLVADPVTSREVTLPTSTVLQVKFLEELGPATTQKGDSVGLALTNDLFVERVLVAPKGSLVDTTVNTVKQPGRFGIPSEIRLDFKSLVPLGPQRIPVTTGAASKKATEEAQKGKDTGAAGIVGAAGASVGGAVLLGPVGLVAGVLVRGNAVKIPAGTIMFLETSGDVRVSGYPVPASL